MSIYAGIDPGQKGALAVISSSNGTVKSDDRWPMPESLRDLRSVLHYLRTLKATVVLEKAQPMPKQGVSSVFSYGVGYGTLIGMLVAFEIPYHEVRPAIWKKEMLAGEPDKKDKKVSIQVCERLFPDVNLFAGARSTTKSDGIAEAYLMAEYGRRRNL
jgi:crossover junction endodeoxyribonuclease RuvC